MNAEIVFLLEPDKGRVTVESSTASHQTVEELKRNLGASIPVNCGRPAFSHIQFSSKPEKVQDNDDGFPTGIPSIYLHRLYHSSVADGPGRRSVVQMSGCSIRCPGCYVPETHELNSGTLIPIDSIVAEIEAKRSEHDGVTILGGEPFDQPHALSDLVTILKERNFHVTIYTGYLVEALRSKCKKSIDDVLNIVDLIIDGPYIREQGRKAGEYRGSLNQRILLNRDFAKN